LRPLRQRLELRGRLTGLGLFTHDAKTIDEIVRALAIVVASSAFDPMNKNPFEKRVTEPKLTVTIEVAAVRAGSSWCWRQRGTAGESRPMGDCQQWRG
jgi:hypothetical protein